MSESGSRPSVDFEPSGVLPRRPPRRPDPVLAATVLVGLGLALAVLKPWGGTSPPATVTPTSRPVPSATASSVGVSAVDPGDRAVAAAIGAAFRPHDGWGVAAVRAAVGRDSLTAFREQWWPATPFKPEGAARLALSASGVVALGITSPRGETPLDVRVFRLGPDDDWQWLDVAPAPALDVGGLDLLPPTVADTPGQAWPPGRYRFDLLMGASIERLDVDIGQAASSGPDPWSVAGTDPSIVAPSASAPTPSGEPSAPTPRDPGVIAVVGGISRSLDGAPRSFSPSPAEAWADTTGSAIVRADGVTSLGVVLPAGAMDPRGSIRRLVPDPVFAGPVARVVTTTDGGPTGALVRFDLPAGSTYGPGVYVLELGWEALDGPQTGIWTVDMTPGSSWQVPPLLEAARRFRSSSGQDALIAAVPPAAAQPVIAFPLPEPAGCNGPGILPQAILGIGHHDGVTVDGVRLTRLGPLGKDIDVAIRRAEAGPGLTLVAPFAGSVFSPGTYTLTVAEPDDLGHVRVCIADRYRG